MAKTSKRKTTSKRSASSRKRAKPKEATERAPYTSGTQGKKPAKPATKATSAKKATRGQRAPQTAKPPTPAPPDSKDKRAGVLDAAVRVLKAAKKPMRCRQIVEVALTKGYWKTNGKTPAATLHSAMLRETQTKGKGSRFRKVERGLFALNASSK